MFDEYSIRPDFGFHDSLREQIVWLKDGVVSDYLRPNPSGPATLWHRLYCCYRFGFFNSSPQAEERANTESKAYCDRYNPSNAIGVTQAMSWFPKAFKKMDAMPNAKPIPMIEVRFRGSNPSCLSLLPADLKLMTLCSA